jgi:hypothetical protein
MRRLPLAAVLALSLAPLGQAAELPETQLAGALAPLPAAPPDPLLSSLGLADALTQAPVSALEAEAFAQDYATGAVAPGDRAAIVQRAATAAGIAARGGLAPPATGLEEALLYAYDVLGFAVSGEQLARLHADASALEPGLAAALGSMVATNAWGTAAVRDMLLRLTPDERDLLRACSNPRDAEGSACPDRERARAVATERVDRALLVEVGLRVLAAVDQGLPALRAAAAADSGAGGEVVFEDPARIVTVGGAGWNYHFGAQASVGLDGAKGPMLSVDLGGDDAYYASSGPMLLSEPPVPLMSQPPLAIGNGLVSVVVDLGGGDLYSADQWNLASATRGVALLLDLGGNDRYAAGSGSEGYALTGLAMLFDAGGDDVYTCTQRCQGHGMLGGLAVVEDAAGNDAYGGTQLAQGAGSTSGAGFLLDAVGFDQYTASGVAPSAAQGVSQFLAVGALVDRAGDDKYTFVSGGRGWIYVPAPPGYDLGAALLVDGQGIDQYNNGVGGNALQWWQGNLGHGRDLAG